MDECLRICIKDVNHNIVCSLCAGYFIDATTITECLHTFCKSCIVKFLQSSKHCPQCNTKIHETQPLVHLRADRVMQDIVYKLVPGLYEKEENRKQEFFKSRGLAKESHEEQEKGQSRSSICTNSEAHRYKNDELILICLEVHPCEMILPVFVKKFVRCPVRTQVSHLKVLLHKKLKLSPDTQVELLCNDDLLHNNMYLKEVYLTHWYGQSFPVKVQYRRSQPQAHISAFQDSQHL